ncbi:MAG: polyprenyl synthetase family protein [Burkholderiales bacterium]|nr:polyprenyl synthetase family protein [Burkholderiales bacterium]
MAGDIAQLNQIIRDDLDSNVLLIKQISEYIISSGGKRIRPILVLLCGRIAGYTDGILLHKMAAMIEYIHTATLLHDDVVDESGMRRGYKTSNAVFGNAASVLVGDFIYTRSFQMMVQSNSLRLLSVMANSTNKISEGEVMQLLNIGRYDLTETEYFSVIESKTAVLFEASAIVASITANTSVPVETNLAQYAKYLGIAFQIVDDILDYTGDATTMGKNIGDDLLEGKVTLPLIYILQHGSLNDQDLVKNAIMNPNNSNMLEIIEIVNKSNAINYCSKTARDYIKQANILLDIFPPSQYKTAMCDLANMAVQRIS